MNQKFDASIIWDYLEMYYCLRTIRVIGIIPVFLPSVVGLIYNYTVWRESNSGPLAFGAKTLPLSQLNHISNLGFLYFTNARGVKCVLKYAIT